MTKKQFRVLYREFLIVDRELLSAYAKGDMSQLLLQLGAFCLIVAVYFLQPMRVRPVTLLAAQRGGTHVVSPSFWFLGLFQAVTGSAALAPLARTAWTALGLSVAIAALAYGLSYVRTLRRIAEEPDITPGVTRFRWLPRFGSAFPTAIVQFSLRTLFRSSQHRVLLAFYWGIGFALTTLLLETPRSQQLAESAAGGWQEGSVPLLVSSIWMMGFAVLAARFAFSMPRDLSANWIFRVAPIPGGRECLRARRRALTVVSVLPVWGVSAIVFLRMWPVGPALGHLAALGLLGLTLIEIGLRGTQKIPFTCSYLPGKSRVHIVVYVAIMLLVPLTFSGAEIERDVLQDASLTALMLGGLFVVWAGVRWQTVRRADTERPEPEFEDEPAERLLTLDVWDSRFGRARQRRPMFYPTELRLSGVPMMGKAPVGARWVHGFDGRGQPRAQCCVHMKRPASSVVIPQCLHALGGELYMEAIA